MNHERANQRALVRELDREDAFSRARRQGRAQQARDQGLYLRFARAHADEDMPEEFNRFCAGIAKQTHVSRHQASTLRQIAQERGWPLQAAGSAKSAPGGPNADRRRAAREAVEQYSGDNRWLHYVQREFLCDPAWLPPEKMAAKITTELASEPTASSAGTGTRFDPGEEPFPP